VDKKISKDIEELNNTINRLKLIDIYRMLYPTKAEYTFFASVHETFININHILNHKTSTITLITVG